MNWIEQKIPASGLTVRVPGAIGVIQQSAPPSVPVSSPASVVEQAVVRLDWVLIDGLTVLWREEMPDDSDGTTVLTRFADIRLQDGQLRARDVHWPVADAGRIQSYEFEANVGTGRVRVSSAGNLTSWRPPTPDEPEWRLQPMMWDPIMRARLTLQQFSAETVSRLVPSPELVAASGVINGSVDFAVLDRSFLRVRAPDLQREGVEYVQLDAQQRYAAGTTANSSFERNLRDTRFRPAALYAATVTKSSLTNPPNAVRVSAVQQTMQLEEGVLESSRNELQQQRPPAVRAQVSGLAGEVVANQLVDELGTQGARAAGAVAEGLIDAAPGGTSGESVECVQACRQQDREYYP